MTNEEMLTALSQRGFKYIETYGLVFYGAIHFGNIFRYENGAVIFYVVTSVNKEFPFVLKNGYKPELSYIDKNYFEYYLDEWIKHKKNKDIELRKKELTKDFE
jgi:hypothetical protein